MLKHTDRPVVLASAGIGNTPMAGMVSHLVRAGAQRKVLLLHADTSPDSFALRHHAAEDLDRLQDRSLAVCFEDPPPHGPGEHERLMNVNALELPAGPQYYLFGTLPFMQAVRGSLIARSVPGRHLPYEVFGPGLWSADFG